MKTLKMGIKNTFGKTIGYKIDREIIDGLFITFDLRKIKDNYENFDIQFQNQLDVYKSNMSIRENVAILSIEIDEDNHVQYLLDHNLSFKKLYEVADNEIPYFFKHKIKECLDIFKKENQTEVYTFNNNNSLYYSISS